MTTAENLPMCPRLSVNDVKAGRLPAGLVAIHWVDSGWTECVAHLTDEAWEEQMPNDANPTGMALFSEVECDACHEADGE